jgi:4-amino-4-deoxy-L-arabinose transferase-like glycosyltransferase
MVTVRPAPYPQPGPAIWPAEAPVTSAASQEAALALLKTLAQAGDDARMAEPDAAPRPRIPRTVPWPLLAILAAQVALSLRLVWANSAFQDEALYLWAGHLERAHWLHGTPVPDLASYFSGAPVIYPALGGLADDLSGLAGARLLSMAFMLGSTVMLYQTACRLFDRKTAIAAAALFATFGPGQQLGAFATYDAMAMFLTALAAYLVIRADGIRAEPRLLLAGLVMALANATKYACVLWDPVLICIAVFMPARSSWPRKLFRGVRLGAYLALPIAIALRAAGPEYVRGITWTTLERQIVTGTAPLRVLDIAWGWLALLLLLGTLGVILIWNDRGRVILSPVVLLAAGLLAPLEQARIDDVTSLHKHVVFGAWFLCMVAGYAAGQIAWLDGRLSLTVIISGVLLAVSAATGYSQASYIAASWPPMPRAMPPLAAAIRSAHCPCLIFQEDAARYYLPPAVLDHEAITGPYSFAYPDRVTRKVIKGPSAMAAAIENGYFGAVEIDGSSPATYPLLRQALRQSGQYERRISVPWATRAGEPTQVWVRTAGLGR